MAFSEILGQFHTVGMRGQPTRFLLSHNRGFHMPPSIPDMLFLFGSGARVYMFSGEIFFILLVAMVSCLCSRRRLHRNLQALVYTRALEANEILHILWAPGQFLAGAKLADFPENCHVNARKK